LTSGRRWGWSDADRAIARRLAERFGCLAMTLEMPFKDNDDLPCAEFGWSPQRSMQLGRDCLAAIMEVMPDL
jgi:murein tripeptide amidase MpaA